MCPGNWKAQKPLYFSFSCLPPAVKPTTSALYKLPSHFSAGEKKEGRLVDDVMIFLWTWSFREKLKANIFSFVYRFVLRELILSESAFIPGCKTRNSHS